MTPVIATLLTIYVIGTLYGIGITAAIRGAEGNLLGKDLFYIIVFGLTWPFYGIFWIIRNW